MFAKTLCVAACVRGSRYSNQPPIKLETQRHTNFTTNASTKCASDRVNDFIFEIFAGAPVLHALATC